jgi:hypothetical protein
VGPAAAWLAPRGAMEVANHLPQTLGGGGPLAVGRTGGVGELFSNLVEINFEVMDKDVVHRLCPAFAYRDGRLRGCQGHFGGWRRVGFPVYKVNTESIPIMTEARLGMAFVILID